MENVLTYCTYSETIRQMPQNYLIASKKLGYWMIDFDISADINLVLRVTKALTTYESRYGDGLNLLSLVTPNEEFKDDFDYTKYKVKFDGRLKGASGITYEIVDFVVFPSGTTDKDVELKLYDKYEHISNLLITKI